MRRISPLQSSRDNKAQDQRLQTDTADELFETRQQALWYNVISLAISDSLKLESNDKYKRIEAIEAIHWLLGGSKDFETVCALASIEPEYLRDQLWPWLHEEYPFALRDGRIVSTSEILKRKTK
jgi:hypothetical protein